jgi:type I restriction enzyme, S subunit
MTLELKVGKLADYEMGFPLPNAWRWKRIVDVCQVNPTISKPKGFLDTTEVSFVPMSAVDDQNGTILSPEIRQLSEVWKGYKRFQNEDVIFARITPCMENGKAAIVSELINGIGCGSTEFHVMRACVNEVIPEWLYHFIRQKSFRDEAAANFTGTAGQLRVPAKFLEQKAIPIPPVPEQLRIVACLESILAQIRTARTALERIAPLLKTFRQSVLSAAFRGELTERDPNDEPAELLLERIRTERRRKWEQNLLAKGKYLADYPYDEPVAPDTFKLPELPDGWVWTTLDQLLCRIEGGHSFRSQGRSAKDGEFGVIKVSAMTWGKFLPKENKALFPDTDPGNTPRIQKGDLLISRANTVELVGAVVLVDEDYPNLLLSDKSLRLIPINKEISKEFLLYALRTRPVREVFEDKATGVSESMRNISQDKIKSASIALPSLQEQFRIIEKIRKANDQIDAVERAVLMASRQLDALEQAALAKAFRGEL